MVTRVKFEEAAARRAQLQAESEDINEQVAQESARLQQTRLAFGNRKYPRDVAGRSATVGGRARADDHRAGRAT